MRSAQREKGTGDEGLAAGEAARVRASLRAADLAELLGVAPESVSHWETGKHEPHRGTLATIGALALDALDGTTRTRDRLQALREPPRPAKVRLTLDPRGRAVR